MRDQLQCDYSVEKLASAGQVFEICSKIKDFKELANIIEKDLAALDPKEFPKTIFEMLLTLIVTHPLQVSCLKVLSLELLLAL